MTWTRRLRGLGLLAAGMVMLAGPAWATIGNLKSYKQAHPDKAGTGSCKTCHQDTIGKATNLNGYGKALQQLFVPANPKQLTPEDIKAADAADPDKDGATTLQELDAGTDPSDANSVPLGTAAQATAAEAQLGVGTSTSAKGGE